MTKIWTDEQVENLNRFQKSNAFHPFTCGGCDNRAGLVATNEGWICSDCDYTQTWAHDHMLNWTQENNDIFFEMFRSKKIKERRIFVFGSNLAGRHGKGAALAAVKQHGAIYGQGYGLQGNSFGIPTKDANIRTLPLDMISSYVEKFIEFAWNSPDLTFDVTPIGCGLAGYDPSDIASMFKNAPPNVCLPKAFTDILDATD